VATVTLTVTEVNEVPFATADVFTTAEDTLLSVAPPGVLGNDIDAEGDPLTANVVSTATNGSLALNTDGSFTYTPALNFGGTDSFTYNVSDGVATSGLATVTLTVTGVNDAPVAALDSHATEEDTTLSVTVPGVLGNDSDTEGDALTANVVSTATNGSLGLNADGSFSYTPNAGFIGEDSFSYVANDGTTDSALATVTLTVAAVNSDAPVANADSYATGENTALSVSAPGVLGNDDMVKGKNRKHRDPLTVYIVNSTLNGSLLLNADGSFDYMPDEIYYGVDSFSYRAYDGTALSDEVTVTILINDVNNPPTIAGTPNSITVPDSQYVFVPDAFDPEGDPLTFSAFGVPAWASFDSMTGTLSGVPSETDIGVYQGILIGVNDGQFTVWMNAFEINVVSATSTVVTLSWLPPTTNTDGSPLLDLSGFKIYYWDEYVYPNTDYSPVVELTNPGLSAHLFELPWPGFWKLAITAYNAEGLESDLSNILPVVAQ
jgi:VCBS repeat-containing protein